MMPINLVRSFPGGGRRGYGGFGRQRGSAWAVLAAQPAVRLFFLKILPSLVFGRSVFFFVGRVVLGGGVVPGLLSVGPVFCSRNQVRILKKKLLTFHFSVQLGGSARSIIAFNRADPPWWNLELHNTHRSVYLRVARVWPCCGYHAGMFTRRIIHPVTHDNAAADHAPGDHAYVHRESRKIFPSRYPPGSPCCAADSSAALAKCCQQVRQLAGDTSKVTVPRLTRRSDTIPSR